LSDDDWALVQSVVNHESYCEALAELRNLSKRPKDYSMALWTGRGSAGVTGPSEIADCFAETEMAPRHWAKAKVSAAVPEEDCGQLRVLDSEEDVPTSWQGSCAADNRITYQLT
jgi:hypothetical protein